MVKDVAAPKQTAGGGFSYEDQVVAYYLVWMLAGTSPFRANGTIERIDCQTQVDGWNGLDDLLLTISERGNHHTALSIKSNLQFTKVAAPTTLVRAAWELLLHRSSEVMDEDLDGFGLICVPHPDPPKVAIQSLLLKARWQTPAQLAERLFTSGYASPAERSIHDSCACPDDLSEELQEYEKLPGRILKKMSVVELDFEHTDSSSEALARFICSHLVQSGSTADSGRLWDRLCRIAQEVRRAGGGLTCEELRQEARKIVELRDFPDFARDWEKLSQWMGTQVDAIPHRMAGTVAINRDALVSKVMGQFESRFVALIGPSGTGKSAIAKAVAKEFEESGDVIWLKGELMRPGYVEALASHQNLDHTLREVLASGRHRRGLIILDNAERLQEETHFAELSLLLNMVSLSDSGCTWRFLVTAREESWERVSLETILQFGHRVTWNTLTIDLPTFESLEPVWREFSTLRSLAQRPHLTRWMQNLKVLDLLCGAVAQGHVPNHQAITGETEMIAWYWRNSVRSGPKSAHRDQLLQKLAIQNADLGQFEVPEAELTGEELDLVSQSSNFLKTDHDRGTVSFTHDLISDWARFRAITTQDESLEQYCKTRFSIPHWHAAIRLYGLYLLETDDTGEQWKETVLATPGGRDILLESLVFAGNARKLLDSVWSVLAEDNGTLLNAYLKRFQHIASMPNPSYMALSIQAGIDPQEARTVERIPLGMYWIGVVGALANHSLDVLALAPTETARIARTWLRSTRENWPGRQEAAALAIDLATQEMCVDTFYYRAPKDAEKLPYKALIEAFSVRPDDVRNLLLKAAGRVKPTKEDGKLFEGYRPPGTVARVTSSFQGWIETEQPPWPEGPCIRVCDSFRSTCLDSDALNVIMVTAPDLAQEIILALLIEYRPSKKEPPDHRWMKLREEEVGLERVHSFSPRFYTRGPFLRFLWASVEAALQTIIRLVDFATERWMESRYEESSRNVGIDISLPDGIRHFVGDPDVFHWYHGHSQTEITSSALMAVEKWLYLNLEKEQDVSSAIELILTASRSVAFLGVLCEVGKFSPNLFAGLLRPLLLVPEIYFEDRRFLRGGGALMGTGASFLEGEWFFNLAREWDAMEHRKRELVQIAAHHFHHHPETRTVLSAARIAWSKLEQPVDERRRANLEALIAQFDEQNWKEDSLPDGRKVLSYYPPEHLAPDPEVISRNEKQMLLISLPLTCRNMISQGQTLGEEEIPAFIRQAKDLAGFEPEDEDVLELSPVANSLLGTIAVLFLLHRDWLEDHPDEEKWCLETLADVLAEPPAWSRFDSPDAIGQETWEHFAADTVPSLWVEDQENTAVREAVLQLAFAKHYSAAGILVSRAFERRNELGDGFWQLVNLIFESAVIRWEITDSKYSKEELDTSKWESEVAQRFLCYDFDAGLPKWAERAISNGKLWSPGNHSRHLLAEKVHLLIKIPKVDMVQIAGTFANIFLPDQAVDDSERAVFLEFWDQALDVCLAGTRFFDKNGEHVPQEVTEAGIPYDSDRWVLQRLATVISQMKPIESPERYWQPILDLGRHAESWIEAFLSHWFHEAKNKMEARFFAHRWIEMVDHCLASENWIPKGRSGHKLPSLWMSLIGSTPYLGSLWQEEDAEILELAVERIENVCSRVMNSQFEAEAFLFWLCENSAKRIRKHMLSEVANYAQEASDYWWQIRDLPRWMARYLSLLWEEHFRSPQVGSEERKVYFALVQRTAKTQEPIALELQANIANDGC